LKPMTFLMLFLLLFLPGARAAGEEPLVLGYYPAWVKNEFPAGMLDFDVLTHIVHAFAWPDSGGDISVWEDFHYPELIAAVHRAGRKISVAFGGWGQCEGFPPVAADPALRAKFIRNALDFCRTHGYDGIDIDWEFPANPAERENLTLLVTELREAINAAGVPLLLTMAVSAGTWSGDHNDYEKLRDVVDWFNDMTYDFYGTWTDRAGHNAPLYATQESVNTSIVFLTEKMGVPPEKIMMGVPFYGRKFHARRLYGESTGGEGIAYRDIVRIMNEGGWSYHWDDVSRVPYLVNESGTELIFFDDPESIALKCRYAGEKNLRGVMIWALGSDYVDGGQPLLETIGRVMERTGD